METTGKAGLVVVLLVAVSFAVVPAAVAAYPPTTRSYYEHNASPTTLYNQGCSAGEAGAHGVAVLDFGRPAYDGVHYGTVDFNGNFDTSDQIRTAAESFAAGFWDCTPAGGPFLTIAIGTNNSCSSGDPHCAGAGLQPASFGRAGTIWAYNVNALREYIESGFAAQEAAAAGDDMEPAWEPAYTRTRDFIAGYNGSSAPPEALFDYGSAEPGYWTTAQEYYVAYGALYDFPLPEIYYAGQPPEWEEISLWGAANGANGAMYFPGVMSQYRAGYGCGFTPHESYDRMLAALQSHTATSQASLDYVTNIVCAT